MKMNFDSDSESMSGPGVVTVTPSIPGLLSPGSQRTRTFAGLHLREWLFLAASFFNITATVGLTIYRLYDVVSENDTSSTDFTFAILILVNAVFCGYYVLDGILRERQYELYAFVAAILVIALYCIIDYIVISLGHKFQFSFKLVRLIAVCALSVPNIILAILCAREFGFLEFRIVGASETFQYMFRQVTLFTCLLKFDFQVAVSLTVLVLEDGIKISTFEKIILGVGIPYSLFWMLLGMLTAYQEKKSLVGLFALLGLAELAYIAYKIYILYAEVFHVKINPTESPLDANTRAYAYCTLAACALALIVRMAVYVELNLVSKNFGKGLKDRAFGQDVDERTSLLSAWRR